MATSGTFSAVWESGYWNSTSNTKWYHWQGSWSRSGTTITLSNQTLYMTFKYASSGYGITDSVSTTGGSAQTVTWTFSSSTTSSTVSLSNSSFSVSGSSTSSTINCVIAAENTGSTTISYDAYYQAPTKPTVSISFDKSKGTIKYGTTSFGTPSSGTVYLYSDTSSTPTTQKVTATSTGTKSYSFSPIGNTKYYARAIAKNSQLSSSYSSTASAISYPGAPHSITPSDITATTAKLSIVVSSQGSANTMTLYYRIGSEGTAASLGTVTSDKTVNATLTGLSPSTEYTVYAYISTSVGKSSEKSVTFTTLDDTKLYGSVDGKAKKITKLYGSVDGKAKAITKLYGSVNGKTKKIWGAN